MKIKDLLEKRVVLDRILKGALPAKLAYRLSKISNKIVSEFKLIEKTRNDLVLKYGKEDPRTKMVEITDEKQKEKFFKEWSDFLETESTLEVQKIPWECIEGITISAVEIDSIADFINLPTEEKPNEAKRSDDSEK